VAIVVGLAVVTSGRVNKSSPDFVFQRVSATKAAISTGLFRDAGFYALLAGIILTLVSLLNVGAWKK